MKINVICSFFLKKNNGVNTNCIIIISKTCRIHDLNLFKKKLCIHILNFNTSVLGIEIIELQENE